MHTRRKLKPLVIGGLFTAWGLSFANAQTHNRSAGNCVLHGEYLKEMRKKAENTVSCIDCYCKVCGDKTVKKTENVSVKPNSSEPQKKTTTPRLTKNKSEEVVLVAPKSKAGKSTTLIRSSEDQRIVDMVKGLGKYDYLSFRSVGPHIIQKEYDNTIELTTMLLSSDSYTTTRLRENFKIKSSLPYDKTYGSINFEEKESFLNTGLYVVEFEGWFQDLKKRFRWNDLVDIQGNCVLNDKDIVHISYNATNQTFFLRKIGQDKPSEEYNPITKKRTLL